MDKRPTRLPRLQRVQTDSPPSPSPPLKTTSSPVHTISSSSSPETARFPTFSELHETFNEPLLPVPKPAPSVALRAGGRSSDAFHDDSQTANPPRRGVRAAAELSPPDFLQEDKRPRHQSSPLSSPHQRASSSCSPTPPPSSPVLMDPRDDEEELRCPASPSSSSLQAPAPPDSDRMTTSTAYATLADDGHTYADAVNPPRINNT